MAPWFEQFVSAAAHGLDTSPTATPFQTRAGTPVDDSLTPHTTLEARTATEMVRIMLRENENTMPVNVTDGSAIIPSRTKWNYLTTYFAFNLFLTMFNKFVMTKCPFPFLLTALHAAFGTIGTHLLLSQGFFTLGHLGSSDQAVLQMYSVLYTANIAVSNLSLSLVTIPFHQVVRSTTPIFTVIIYRFFLAGAYTNATYLSLVPVVVGVGLATYGDYYATLTGFLITLLGAILAAMKTIATNRLQTAGLHLTAMELLYRMSPLALMQSITMALLNGELGSFYHYAMSLQRNPALKTLLALAINGAIAFGLNVVSFTTNKHVGALTMTVAANVKQTLTVVLAIAFWDLRVGVMNAFGIAMTLLGGFWYARVGMGAAGGQGRDVETA